MSDKDLNQKSFLYRPTFFFDKDFKEVSIFSLAIWTNGSAFKTSDYQKEGLPIIKIAEIKNGITNQTKFANLLKKEKFLIKKGDILFSWSGQPETSIDVTLFSNNKGLLNQHIFRVDPLEKSITRNYFFYLMKYLKGNFIEIAKNKQTTGLGHVTKSDLEKIFVRFPSNENVQDSISYILKTIDKKIELLKDQQETIEEITNTLYKSWFIDFNPVKIRNKGFQQELPSEINDLFPNSFVNSELGEIPSGWSICTIGDLLDLKRDSIKPEQSPNETFSHYSIPSFDNKMVPSDELGESIKSNKYLIDETVFLVSKLNPRFPRIWLPSNNCNKRKICSTEFLVCKPKKAIDKSFTFCLSRSNEIMQRLIALASGTSSSHQRVRPDDFLSIKIACPPRSIIEFFAKKIDPLLQKILCIRNEDMTLNDIRDTLLPKLISGEIQISDAEKIKEWIDI